MTALPARFEGRAARAGGWAVLGLWLLLLAALPVTSFPPLLKLVNAVVMPFSFIPLLVILAVWFAPYILRRGALPAETRPLLAFLAAALVSTLVGLVLDVAYIKGREALGQSARALLTLGIGVSFYFALAAWASTETRLRRAVQFINIGGVVLIAWALAQAYFIEVRDVNYPKWFFDIWDRLVLQIEYVRFSNRVTGLAYEPSWFAHMLTVLYFPLWLSAIYQGTSAFPRLWKFSLEQALLVLGLVVFFLSSPRVGMLAFLLMAAYLALRFSTALHRRVLARLFRGREPSRGARAAAGVGLALLMVAVYAALAGGLLWLVINVWSQRDPRMQLLTQMGLSPAELALLKQFNEHTLLYFGQRLAFAERIVYWLGGWHIFNAHPLFGVGLGNAGFYFFDAMPAEGWGLTETRALMFDPASLANIKSLWVRLLAETGLVGFAAFAAWLAVLWRSASASQVSRSGTVRLVGLAGQLALVAFLAEGFSVDSFAMPYLWVVAALAAAAGAVGRGLAARR